MTIKHLSLFTGIGGASEALRQAGLDSKTVGFSEMNKSTIKLFRAFHGDEPCALGDLTKIDIPKLKSLGTIDLITAGFPCQSFSRLGKGLGWTCTKLQHLLGCLKGIILYSKPKHVLIENVKAITENPHADGWKKLLEWFQWNGYSYSLHHGNPRDMGYLQSRNRVYVAFSRDDAPHWNIESVAMRLPHDQQFEPDSSACTLTNCYKINPKRAVRVFNENGVDHFSCVTALAGDSHCKRATWIRQSNGDARGWTINELYQLFGWNRKPNIVISPRGISRATVYRGFGNSWHVGHASGLFTSYPCKHC